MVLMLLTLNQVCILNLSEMKMKKSLKKNKVFLTLFFTYLVTSVLLVAFIVFFWIGSEDDYNAARRADVHSVFILKAVTGAVAGVLLSLVGFAVYSLLFGRGESINSSYILKVSFYQAFILFLEAIIISYLLYY